MLRRALPLLIALALLAGIASSAAAQTTTAYTQKNLVSDVPGSAPTTDPHLVNPWGIAATPTSPLWIADNGTGVSTLYGSTGKPAPLVVTVPPPKGGPAGTAAAPSGAVANGTPDFSIGQGSASKPAQFIFATEDGTISAWNTSVNRTAAILVVDNSAGARAVYKGLTIASNGSGNFLLASNFRGGTVDVFDRHFRPSRLSGGFRDPNVPAGFAPFGIQNVDGNIVVTYAKQDAEKHDDVGGPGNGFVDLFDADGKLLRRLASGGPLNSPWGIALAPADFGTFSNALLVGNFGDGRISGFDPNTGAFRGQLSDSSGRPIAIPGLWGLRFGNGAAGNPRTLFFTAGIQGEQHGLFGTLTALPATAGTATSPRALPNTGEAAPFGPTILLGLGLLGTGFLLRRRATHHPILAQLADGHGAERRRTAILGRGSSRTSNRFGSSPGEAGRAARVGAEPVGPNRRAIEEAGRREGIVVPDSGR